MRLPSSSACTNGAGGPKPPSGWEQNWIESLPNKGWFADFRFYGPTEGYFERTYPLPHFEEMAKTE